MLAGGLLHGHQVREITGSVTRAVGEMLHKGEKEETEFTCHFRTVLVWQCLMDSQT
jgi:hypothetical protein